MQRPNRRRVAGAAATTLTACSLFAAATLPAAAMTVTFIRHAESQGNASGYIDTETPGPHLTTEGQSEAASVPGKLEGYGYDLDAYDAIYASTMIRTQETANPLSQSINKPVVVVGGFNPNKPTENSGVEEIGAGIFEGLPESGTGGLMYIAAPLAWTLGARFVRIPGGEDGNEFDERVDNALAGMEEDGSETPVVFSHGATIMMWTLMNVDNPDFALMAQRLDNTDVVVVESNGEGGWTLKRWGDTEVGPANYPTKMFVNVRDLVVAPQTALYHMRTPVLSLDPQGIITTGAQGVQDVAQAGVKFVKDSVTDTVDAITGIPGSIGQSTSQVSKVSTLNAVADSDTPAVADLAEGATSEVKKVAESVKPTISPLRAANGATKLTDGNKAEPGKALSAVRDRVNRAADDVRSGVESSAQQARETVKKLTGADKANKAGKSDNTGKPKAASKDAA